MQTIAAIPTKYNGVTFRSRLEARWAVFFDNLNIEWQYEREGYQLQDGTWYVPDFWLPGVHYRENGQPGIWVEIKPRPHMGKWHPWNESNPDYKLHREKIFGIPGSGVITYGDPWEAHQYADGASTSIIDSWDLSIALALCNQCSRKSFIYQEETHYRCCPNCSEGRLVTMGDIHLFALPHIATTSNCPYLIGANKIANLNTFAKEAQKHRFH